MKAVLRWLRKWWWTILVGVATVGGFFFWLLLPRPKDDDEDHPGRPVQRTFKDKAKEEVERVRLEGEVEKARVQAAAEVHRQQLDDIEIIGEQDPAEARRQLATWLANNL